MRNQPFLQFRLLHVGLRLNHIGGLRQKPADGAVVRTRRGLAGSARGLRRQGLSVRV